MAITNPTQLSEDQIETALEHVIDLRPFDLLHKKLGFSSRYQFHKFLVANPEIDERLHQAKIGACRYLEDDLLYVNDDHDPKAARVKLEAITKLLVFLNPAKYSQKIDISMNQTISIRSNLDASTKRIESIMRDVSPNKNAALDQAALVSFNLPVE